MIISGQHPMKDEKSRYILHWIGQLSKVRPELGNFAICPYASKANFIILDEELRKVRPRWGWEVVIFAVEDEHDPDFLYAMVDDYNRNYSDFKFIADHQKKKTYIQGVQTSNGKYNLVLCQPRNELTEARKKLSKTDYYKYWDKSYLKEVLEEDYSVVNTNLNDNQDK